MQSLFVRRFKSHYPSILPYFIMQPSLTFFLFNSLKEVSHFLMCFYLLFYPLQPRKCPVNHFSLCTLFVRSLQLVIFLCCLHITIKRWTCDTLWNGYFEKLFACNFALQTHAHSFMQHQHHWSSSRPWPCCCIAICSLYCIHLNKVELIDCLPFGFVLRAKENEKLKQCHINDKNIHCLIKPSKQNKLMTRFSFLVSFRFGVMVIMKLYD